MSKRCEMGRRKPTWALGNNIKQHRDSVGIQSFSIKKEEKEIDLSLMIGRKIPSAGKSKSFEYDGEFKMSSRIARQKRRARRARKLRNGWMFGRKIRVGTQLYPVKFIDFPAPEPQFFTTLDEDGVEHTYCAYSCTYPRPEPKVVKQPDPGYDDVFKFFGDLADYYYDEVVFTFGNEPGSIPIDAELSFIPPAVSNVTKGGKAKRSPARG